MNDQTIAAALAGLLHDVGKVRQRALVEPWKAAPGSEEVAPPVHASWSDYFIGHSVPKRYRPAARPGAYHHSPDKSPAEDRSLSEIVALADKLSAGERADRTDEYPAKNPPQQLVSIFDRLALKADLPTPQHYMPLLPLTLREEAIFPDGAQTSNLRADAYEELRTELEAAARVDQPDAETYLESLLETMLQHTWCVPSAYYHSVPDVSLYDHSRMTAALAVCLKNLEQQRIRDVLAATQRLFRTKESQADRELLDQPIALLVGGDISGVQDFIYTLSSKAAAKTLRGRSFYLQLLTEAVLRYLLRELELPYTNVIYSGGGHFFFLAPLNARAKLKAVGAQVTRILLQRHGTALYLAVGTAELPASGFRLGVFPKHWGAMHRDLGRAKQQRYVELQGGLHQAVFAVDEHGGNREKFCSVCGGDSRDVKSLEGEDDIPGQDNRICALCSSFQVLGSQLRNRQFVVLGLGTSQKASGESALDTLQAFGMSVRFPTPGGKSKVDLPQWVKRSVIWALDDVVESGRWPQITGDIPAVHVTRHTVNQAPEMDFGQLQEKAEGIPRLGVLRMDVDDLGDLFTRGLEERGTLARLSTLSLQVSLFFDGWIKRLCETGKYEGLIYAVYAGGDDVFLIGPWDKMPVLAQQIAADLKRYSGGHPDIHVSGGMAFIHGKYPVYQAADDAADALNSAKECDGKSAFTFLGQTWKWTEFEKLYAKSDRVRKLIQEYQGPTSLIQLLRRLAHDEADSAKRTNGRPVWGPWMWHGTYRLFRMARQYEQSKPEVAAELTAIRRELAANDYSEIGQWGAAARWVQLILRESD